MSNYDEAYKIVARNEGGYADDPTDKGGQTIFGLTRRDWPNWSGWPVVDKVLAINGKAKGIPMLNANQPLKDSVKNLFKANYWDAISAGSINDQQLANQAFDTAINMGVGRSAKFLQLACGVTVDLHIGPATLAAVNAMNPSVVYGEFLRYRKAKYDDIIKADPRQVKFKASWYSRLTPYKNA